MTVWRRRALGSLGALMWLALPSWADPRVPPLPGPSLPAPQAPGSPGEVPRALSDLLLQAFLEAGRIGHLEGQPERPRTLNARSRWPDLDREPPAPGVGRRLTVRAYAYHLGGLTARGTRTRMGTIAVDPRVIPLGSTLYIPGYGWGRAVDTGGAIRGDKIDVWFPTRGQCLQWGVRSVEAVVFP